MYATGVNKIFEVNQVSSRTPKVRSGSNLIGFFIGDSIMGCVYLAENTINRKCYIGKTIGTLEQRKRGHYNDARLHNNTFNNYFHNALRKYKQEFEWIVLYESDNNKKLIEKEIHFIKKYKTNSPNGYNLTNGGDGMVGYIYSEASRKKMSKAHKGKIKPHLETTKQKMRKPKRSNINYLNHLVTKKTRKKISTSLRHHFISKTTKRKISKTLKEYYKTRNGTMFGKHHTIEAKRKITEANKRRYNEV